MPTAGLRASHRQLLTEASIARDATPFVVAGEVAFSVSPPSNCLSKRTVYLSLALVTNAACMACVILRNCRLPQQFDHWTIVPPVRITYRGVQGN
jgi:hypothetical protein